jgi:hypothetical protein
VNENCSLRYGLCGYVTFFALAAVFLADTAVVDLERLVTENGNAPCANRLHFAPTSTATRTIRR